MVSRWFVRCPLCLSVSAITERLPYGARCGLCTGTLEIMGQVDRDRLIREEDRTPCDERCTNARGPHCDCRCGGEHHGTKRIVRIVTDCGPVPTVTPTRDREQASARVTEYLAMRDAALRQMDTLHALRRASGWLTTSDYGKLCGLQIALKKANAARDHAARIRALRTVVPMPLPAPAPTTTTTRPIVPTTARVQLSMFP